MFGARGPAGLRGGFLAERKPTGTGGGGATPSYSKATLGTARNLTALFQAQQGAISNYYQTNFRVDPAAPNLRQSASFKLQTAEKLKGFIWTIDGWATYNSFQQDNCGDPDTIWTNSGDLLLGYLGSTGSVPYQTRLVPGGGATVNAPIGATTTGIDFAHFFAHRPTGRIYVCGRNDAANGVSIGYTDDGGLTWTKRSKGFTSAINAGFTSQGCQTDKGTILLPQSTKTTILSSGGVYAGTQQDAYILRSIDQGVSWTAIYAFSMNRPKVSIGGIIHTHNMWHHKGRVHWVQAKVAANNAPCLPFYGYSDDDGLSFTWNTAAIPQPWAGAGIQQAWIGAQDGVIVVHAVWVTSAGKFQFWAHYSFDGGATWTARQVSPGTQSDRYDITPRIIGDDQNDCDLVGDTAYLIWPDNSVGGAQYSAYINGLTFS